MFVRIRLIPLGLTTLIAVDERHMIRDDNEYAEMFCILMSDNLLNDISWVLVLCTIRLTDGFISLIDDLVDARIGTHGR
jgi:hypothetical protein